LKSLDDGFAKLVAYLLQFIDLQGLNKMPEPWVLCRKRSDAVKTTKYFQSIRTRPDRAIIKDEWIQHVVESPEREYTQTDGRVRRWAKIDENEGRYLRVVLLPDRETVHNAFFDRRFRP
jgi:hypothetical protein